MCEEPLQIIYIYIGNWKKRKSIHSLYINPIWLILTLYSKSLITIDHCLTTSLQPINHHICICYYLLWTLYYIMCVSKRNIDKEYIGALTNMHYVDWAQFSKLRSGLATVWPLAENLAITFIYEIVCYGSLNQILCVSMGKCDFNDHSQPGLKWMKLIFYTFF